MALFLVSWRAEAQLDPVKRRLVQLGYNQPMEGEGPLAGYAFYYLNDPAFFSTNMALRLAIAPVYLDSELGFRRVLGPNTDLGIPLSGGGFADSYSEIRQGDFLRSESFTGHGITPGLSLYHLFNPDQRIPLHGVIRGSYHHGWYQRDSDTDRAFVLPQDLSEFALRAGVRWGGTEPTIFPTLAMELSAWYEALLRLSSGRYGYVQDREVESSVHLFWARGLLAYTLPESKHQFSVSLTAGTSVDVDRFSSYRIGGVLPLMSEFSLNLPGYYWQELSASRFVLVGGQYLLPLNPSKTWCVLANASTALVEYTRGLEQAGSWNSGVGGGIMYQTKSRAWKVIVGYGYGIDAIRSHGRGANSVGFLCQYDLEASRDAEGADTRPRFNPNILRGVDWLLGR